MGTLQYRSTRGYYHSTHGYCTVPPVVPDGHIVPAIVPIAPSIVPIVPQKTGYYGTTARYYLVPARVTTYSTLDIRVPVCYDVL